MKRVFIMALVAISLIGCKDDEDVKVLDGDAGVVVRINIDREKTKAIEDAHPNDTYVPKVYSASVLAYNNSGTLIQQIDLTDAELQKAIIGKYTNSAGSEVTGGTTAAANGAVVGLPAGTVRVDVVLNNPSTKYTDLSTNINYYNFRDRTDGGSSDNYFGKNNFDRVFLVTSNYGTGSDLSSFSQDATTGYYTKEFTVAPATARFEVTGAIDVKPEETYKDKFEREWAIISGTDLVTYMKNNKSSFNATSYSDEEYGKLSDNNLIYNCFTDNSRSNFLYGARADKKGDAGGTDYEKYDYYYPKYYWHTTSNASPGTLNEGDVKNDESTDKTWVNSPLWKISGITSLQWFPNEYYAVDVEEIYINNIKVTGPTSQPYLHPWPGDDGKNGWAEWYKSYHTDGWHKSGTSGNNKFLCMGNMWDRIIKENTGTGTWKKVDWAADGLNIPSVTGSGLLDMSCLQAGPVTLDPAKAEFYSTDHNLGIIKNHAAAYHFYAQSSTSSNKETLSSQLPHIILKVKCYDSETNYKSGTIVDSYEFITIKLFSTSQTDLSKYESNFKSGYIYRLSLNDLLPFFVGKAPIPGNGQVDDDVIVTPSNPVDPQPEMPGVNLSVGIKVTPWTSENVYPVI